ncbi:MAG: ankyrin repeat domain-containing protein [Pedobacter sp.]
MKKLAIVFFAMISLSSQAQTNVFLDQSFWKSNPDTVAIKGEILKGSSPSQLNASSFDAVVTAINANTPFENVKFLLAQKGNDVNKLTHDGRTYIFWAASRGNVELMEFLISKGAKVNMVDNHGYSVANFAAVGGQQNTKVYDLCLKNGADLKKDLTHEGANALLLAAANDKDFALTNYFVSKGLDINSTDAEGNTAFNYATKSGNIPLLKSLLEKGVKFTDNAMILASAGSRSGSNTLEVYQYMESLKIKPNVINKDGQNALHAIVRRPKQEEIIKYFMAKGADINQADAEGNTPFMNAAAANSDVELITFLSSSAKNINQTNKKGASALAMAVRGNSPEVVSLLLTKGADLKVVDAAGDKLAAYLINAYTPQKSEVFTGKMKLLQEKGLDLVSAQQNGNTLYHIALVKNDLTLIKSLESLKLDVNAKNKEGMTVLHKAAMTAKDDRILKYLVSIGAKKEVVTEFKETAFDLAGENEFLSKNSVSIDFLK